MIALDTSVLLAHYQSRSRATGGSPLTAAGTAPAKAPTPPWEIGGGRKPMQVPELVRQALMGRSFVDERSAQLDVKGASADYRKLFAAYGGLNMLSALAERAGDSSVSALERMQLERRFAAGLRQVTEYVDGIDFESLRLTEGKRSTEARSASFATGRSSYTGAAIHAGGLTNEVAAFTGPVLIDMEVDSLTAAPVTIRIDLADMGAQPRSIANVINFMNAELEAAGVKTRMGYTVTPGETQRNGLPTGPDRYALKVKPGAGEAVAFSAPDTAAAVYLTQGAGKTDATAGTTERRQLLKFGTDVVTAGAAPPGTVPRPGDAHVAEGRVFARDLGAEIAAARASATGPDGSLYVLADVNGATAGQAIKGARDVALNKYDAAGNLVWSRTLGAADQASGFSLAVGADGRVAVAGAIHGALNPDEIMADAGKTDSFVAVFKADGDEQWSWRKGAFAEDEASAVAWGEDGTLYLAGRSKSAMPGATHTGGWDGYLQAFGTNAQGLPTQKFVTGFGAAGDQTIAGLAVQNGQVVVAGLDGADATVRSFDVTGADPTLSATHSLGALNGGRLAGVAFDGAEVVLAGSSGSGALNGGTVSGAYGGGQDAFVARLGSDLTPSRIAYWGGAGDDTVSAFTISGGEVWIAGSSSGEIAGTTKVGARDGFLARLDDATGTAEFARRWSGQDGQVAPTSIAVDAQGSSVLDRLGLPSGAIAFETAPPGSTSDSSPKVTALTSARAGDGFFVSANGGRKVAVTLEANDTFKTLATKIGRALGFQGSAVMKTDGASGTVRLQITSRSKDSVIEITAGKGGRDMLEALGLAEGEVRTLPAGVTEQSLRDADEPKTYALGLSSDLNLSSKAEIKRAFDQMQAALTVIRGAYRDLKAAGEPKAPQITGEAPAYLTRQLASYQDALRRLGG